MAKIAQVGYGHNGRGVNKKTGDGYTYVVNDNVRTGDVIQPIATSKKGKKFATTGVLLHAYKQTSAKGQALKTKTDNETDKEVSRIYSGKELQADGKKNKIDTGIEGLKKNSVYNMQTRAGNIGKAKQDGYTNFTTHAQETYDQYSKKFIPNNNKNQGGTN